MIVNDIIDKLPLTDQECVLIFRRIILFYERAGTDDDTFNLNDQRIQNYCKREKLKIKPLNNVPEVNDFCHKTGDLLKNNPFGLIVFSHHSKNQLRQLIHHMRNACSHAGIRIISKDGNEYIEFKAKYKNKIKLLALIPREKFEHFWNIVLSTLK